MTQTKPEVRTTTTASETPIADAIARELPAPADPFDAADIPAAPEVEPAESPAEFRPDLDALAHAAGNPEVWAHQLYLLVGAVTGKYIDESSLNEWLQMFATQVQAAAIKSVLFAVASTPVSPHVPGDAAVALLEFRDELARSFRTAAQL